jgi:hypothetical protein
MAEKWIYDHLMIKRLVVLDAIFEFNVNSALVVMTSIKLINTPTHGFLTKYKNGNGPKYMAPQERNIPQRAKATR